jgi:hypothetical protein
MVSKRFREVLVDLSTVNQMKTIVSSSMVMIDDATLHQLHLQA